VEVALEEQAKVAEAFLRGLTDEMGLAAEISTHQDGEESVELTLEGPDLGLLIGPKGATLLALQDLTRTAVQRKTGASNGRMWIDVSGYRQKRAVALGRFAQQVANEVLSSGNRKAMEPMNAADRKVVHDTINDIPGVATLSEGEDADRRVVVYPVTETE
jgi:spoIIIJ-associated protein